MLKMVRNLDDTSNQVFFNSLIKPDAALPRGGLLCSSRSMRPTARIARVAVTELRNDKSIERASSSQQQVAKKIHLGHRFRYQGFVS